MPRTVIQQSNVTFSRVAKGAALGVPIGPLIGGG